MNTVIWLTEQDYSRLNHVLSTLAYQPNDMQAGAETLEDILDLARVVRADKVPDNVVTMNSRVQFEDLRTREIGTVTIAFPAEADASDGKISVMSPVGAALIGLSEGEQAQLPLPRGRTRLIRISSVLYQPEAEGHFAL